MQSLFLLNLKVVEPSALRWMAGRKGWDCLWFDGRLRASARCWTPGGMSNFWDGFLWCCDGMCGMIYVSYKIWPFIWFLLASMSEAFFQKYL